MMSGSMFLENLRLALASIASNRLRATLTVLGVLVGVFSVTLIVSLGAVDSRDSGIERIVIQGFSLGGDLGCDGSAGSE
jgi:hypothetical protein